MTIAQLQTSHGIPGRVDVRQAADGAALIEITAPGGRALVALKGGHVLSWIPAGRSEVLWLSPVADIAGPAAIRGGVPVCWPWFATHPTDADKPMHGFARTAHWRVLRTDAAAGETRVVLGFETRPEHAALWPHAAALSLEIVVGDRLGLVLETHNTGGAAFELTQALHTYFAVADISHVTVEGLDATDYLDKVDGFARKTQSGAVTFDGEVDRIYVGTPAETTIVDPGLGRRITIAKRGSASTVVWNPGPVRAARMADVGPEQWRRYVCVETTNAGPDVVHLAPGARHVLAAEYRVRR